jgi:F420-dependent oxidoreductase-like protein
MVPHPPDQEGDRVTSAVVIRPGLDGANAVDDALDHVRRAAELGVRDVWFAQRYDLDALTLCAVTGTAVPEVTVGTAIVPINPRHPLLVASAAQTIQAATHGRFRLGIGLGGNALEKRSFGLPPIKQVTRLREYLTVLDAIVADGTVDFDGDEIVAHTQIAATVPGGRPFPIYVAAMGPKALGIAGSAAEGTITYLAGPRTIAEAIKPVIDAAAADAGRPAPQIIASVPVAITDDRDTARGYASTALDFYDQFPSYQRVFATEGVEHATDLAVIGDVDHVTRELDRYRAAGATDLLLSPFYTDPELLDALWRFAATY